MIEPLAAAGFEVIVPDLRGFGDSDVGPDGFHDVPAHAATSTRSCTTTSATTVVLVGGDLGGPVIQDLALRFPRWVDRMVLFNSPLPFDKERMAGMATRPASEASDYFVRQGTDPDGLARRARHARAAPPLHRDLLHVAVLGPPRRVHRRGGSRGRFGASEAVDFHTEPFADGAKLRASFGGYESAFTGAARGSEPTTMARRTSRNASSCSAPPIT